MKKYKGYLIDLDGTVYRGNEVIPEAIPFVKQLAEKNIPYVFVTNNSTKSTREVAEKLNGLGILANHKQVVTSSMATAKYLQDQSVKTCYCIGQSGLKNPIKEYGIQLTDSTDADAVVVGLDRDITYDKLAKACIAIRKGAQFISTNRDHAIPTEDGMGPGNGAFTALIQTSTQQAPVFIGKPDTVIMKEALDVLGLRREDVVMVGDNYQTDIQSGIHAGVDTLFVSTGVTSTEELATFEEQPTYIIENLSEWTFE
ncbi:haloacid dehalogenase [Oceanobacillus oncorhynchi subsp. incaldanensis]|uniref:TIGR01457 family HAD-type hydrolase n=1 Tax=Oceanobacillus oncorhynchi TaxID=545501 RepID=UPI001B134E20|nr:TIGR01457 family HAD-type hydrolase [Oceanobacillus oncorhynchi]UUI38974.1 TIGR01457 family HAD-type hydrolase [Oceanobacillus oncorhynchi]GIO19237.1 haloacid dehalogenase [Oceanobacillus oncorhynchi subsp. incaldanensis]